MEVKLYDHIDPDALDQIMAQESNVVVSFTMSEYEIIVHSDGCLCVRSADSTEE